MKDPLTEAELQALARRLGGVRELVAPKRKKETEGMPDAEVVPFLSKNPNYVRRPIIDTGKLAVGGFTAETRAKLDL